MGISVFELEADSTIPAEYVLLDALAGRNARPSARRQDRRVSAPQQGENGGWPLFEGGRFNISASVKAYFALKMIGDDPGAPHMVRAREAILAHGGAARTNVFTRTLLALYGAIPWRKRAVMPVEILLLPRWFPFHIAKISYWGRTVLVPLTVLNALRPLARNPRQVVIPELFCTPPEVVRRWPKGEHHRFPWSQIFRAIDRVLQVIEPHFPTGLRQRAIQKAVQFTTERLNGSTAGRDLSGHGQTRDDVRRAGLSRRPSRPGRRAPIGRSVAPDQGRRGLLPAMRFAGLDTGLAVHALLEVGSDEAVTSAGRGLQWLQPRQVLDTVGDWAMTRPRVAPADGLSSTNNPHYPDIDDSAVVLMAMDRAIREARLPDGATSIRRSRAVSNGCSGCRAATADSAPSTPTTIANI